jgi:lysyl-tRNA synthetase class 2
MKYTPDENAGWQPAACREMLQMRAGMLAQIRRFFTDRDVLEVETPVLSQAGTTDPNIESFRTRYEGPGLPAGQTLYLATSPEFHMKRLLAAGSGDIYQISRVFRQTEFGRWHNPEFTLLEWYRIGFDMRALMREVEQLVRQLLAPQHEFLATEFISYREAFQRHLSIDPLTASPRQLQQCASSLQIEVSGLAPNDRDAWLDLLMSHGVQPQLGKTGMCFVYDYPATQAALARVRPEAIPVAERFELFIDGVELANGFHELDDAQEQARRFERDLAIRQQRGAEKVTSDPYLIEALRHGLPDCCGVAVGVDRLLQIKSGTKTLHQCLVFPLNRA